MKPHRITEKLEQMTDRERRLYYSGCQQIIKRFDPKNRKRQAQARAMTEAGLTEKEITDELSSS